MKQASLIIMLLLVWGQLMLAQTFCLQFEEVFNDGSEYIVALQMAGSSDIPLGSSNLEFSYNTAGLANPRLHASILSASPFYQAPTVTRPGTGFCSLNIELASIGSGEVITGTFTTVAEVKFDIIDGSEMSGLFWSYNGGTTKTVVFRDDEATQLMATSLPCLLSLNEVLPVELLTFQATPQNMAIDLAWRSTQELNFAGYEIERSPDARVFSGIGWVPAKGGVWETSYQYTDTDVAPGRTYYYRLKLLDLDGSFEYSPLRQATLKTNAETQMRVFPNPANDQMSLHWFANGPGDGQVKLYNPLGQLVYQQPFSVAARGQQMMEIVLASFAPGVYQVVLEQGNAHQSTQSLLIEQP